MIYLNNIKFENGGRRIVYDYKYDSNLGKYFNKSEQFYVEYDIDVQSIPSSIAAIPFLANFAPISWFVGCSISIEEADQDFIDALESIKNVFIAEYPHIGLNQSKICFKRQVKNNYAANNSGTLFSGGVDAYSTYFSHVAETPDLITIKGADVDITNSTIWERIKLLNEHEVLLSGNQKLYITSNLRTFYTHNVDLLLKGINWWSKVQHGLALTALLAPLSAIRGYSTIYIASSYTENADFFWGSSPQIDNKVKWGNTKIVHDGYQLRRQDKVDLIVKATEALNKSIILRVCYALSESNQRVNCSKCEKCYRTILGLILSGANPNDYGFDTSAHVYDEIETMFKNGFSSEGVKYFWGELLHKMTNSNAFYYFADKNSEQTTLLKIKQLFLYLLNHKKFNDEEI